MQTPPPSRCTRAASTRDPEKRRLPCRRHKHAGRQLRRRQGSCTRIRASTVTEATARAQKPQQGQRRRSAGSEAVSTASEAAPRQRRRSTISEDVSTISEAAARSAKQLAPSAKQLAPSVKQLAPS